MITLMVQPKQLEEVIMGRQQVILLIDDDEDDVSILSDALEMTSKAYKLIRAVNGEEGLEKLQNLLAGNIRPCLIILDINMPKLNGKEFIAMFREKNYSPIPIVVFTTSNHSSERSYFEKYNVEVITKPYSFTDYIEVAKRLVSHCS